ncbi:MAG TPA: exopolyphosphatase [Usitatibacteraceae bacterium]|nr:exopolyphosphatase [Usitatibacteraceae bacterium]
MPANVLAAVDLGSNSFHLQIARVVEDHLYPQDSLKETVRLGAGVTQDRRIDARTEERALNVLSQFAERLRGLPKSSVRVVGTNALRVAKNSAEFIAKAEAVLGFPIEVIAGREEARLIYIGVAQSLPPSPRTRLVVDIGGGSTEFIIGHKLKPKLLDSLYMGCVSYSERYFPGAVVDKRRFKDAQLAARKELEQMADRFIREGWHEAIGSSGTARALATILEQNGQAESGITLEGLSWLRETAIKAGGFHALDLPGLKSDRVPVLPGGLAIMLTLCEELAIERMQVADTALRDGVLFDLLGRTHHDDIRDTTVQAMARRYHVDNAQVERVRRLALRLFDSVDLATDAERAFQRRQKLEWAARLHEIGVDIAQAGFHKHSAYVIANADMPGFSKREQAELSLLVLAQRGRLAKLPAEAIASESQQARIVCLRLAVLLCRSRRSVDPARFALACINQEWRLKVDAAWLERNSLTAYELDQEAIEWAEAGVRFTIN